MPSNRNCKQKRTLLLERAMNFAVLLIPVALLVGATLLFYTNTQRKNVLFLGRMVMENHLKT